MSLHSSTPKLSILCPIFNVKNYIGQTIESVLAQSYQDWELIIKDGASTDGTVEVVQRYAEKDSRIRFYSERDKGAWPATDQALDLARGTHITLIYGQDGYLDPDWFARAMEVFEKDKEVSLVWALNLEMTEDGVLIEKTHMSYSHLAEKESSAKGIRFAIKKAFSIVWELVSGSSTRRQILLRKLFSKTVFFKFNFFFKRGMPAGQVPQKQAWFRYWLDTGMVFPDESMIIDKRVFTECYARYSVDQGELGSVADFYYKFNTKGYLAWYLPMHASFGRSHGGSSGERKPVELFENSERYLSQVLAMRKKVLASREPMVFREPSGKAIKSTS